MASFSIIVPSGNREKTISRTIESVLNQSYPDYELILIDDASSDETLKIMKMYQEQDDRIKVISHQRRLERVASRNDGMVIARNDWICWLDSDDEYMTIYLEVLNDAIDRYPDYRIFNFGSIIHHHRTKDEYLTKIGGVFKPAIEGKGHENFKSGLIGTGRFIFHRHLLDEIPLMAPCYRPYGDGSEVIGDMGPMGEVNPNPNYPRREDGQWVPYGNPWGEDYHWFWKITRENLSQPLDMFLYIEHKRA